MQLNQWVVHSRLSAGSLEFLKVSRVQTDHLSETLPSVTELWYLQRKKPPPDRYVLPTAGISRRRLSFFYRKNECIIFDLKPAPYTGLSSYVVTDGWHWINLRVESTLASFLMRFLSRSKKDWFSSTHLVMETAGNDMFPISMNQCVKWSNQTVS